MEHIGTLNIETNRLLLRRFVKEDALAMYKNWANDSDVTKYLSWTPHENVEVTKEILNTWIGEYDSKETYRWAIVPKDKGRPVGIIDSVNDYPGQDKCEIGYCLSKDYWGKGIMTESLEAVIAFLFTRVGYNRIQAYHHTENKGSGRVMEKAGMNYEGRLREYVKDTSGRYVDCDIYSILASEYGEK